MSAKASGADSSANGEARHRQHHDGSAGRAYTVEQKAAVLRIRRCSPTAYYEILGLEEKKAVCSEGEIKKAYRKLSLLTHPDKNGYEGADEAFKLVSRAFQVLSDSDKKAKYDKFGGDPDNRFGGGASAASGASPFSGFARSTGGAPGGGFYQEEMSPEELFRQFFGGGAFGGPFGGMGFDTGGPGFVFNMGGGPGIRVHQFGGGRPRRRPTTAEAAAAQQQPSLTATLSSLLPLLFLFILPLLSSLFSGGGSSSAAGPSLRFDAAVPPHTQQRTSARLNIPYWVNPADVDDLTARKLKELDRTAEVRYMSHLNVECDVEQQRQARLMQDAQGWFFVDETKMREARNLPKPSCSRLRELGYGR